MKQTYWRCVDCGSIINDANMHDLCRDFNNTGLRFDIRYAEFCYGCMIYNPEVVIACQ